MIRQEFMVFLAFRLSARRLTLLNFCLPGSDFIDSFPPIVLPLSYRQLDIDRQRSSLGQALLKAIKRFSTEATTAATKKKDCD